MFNLIRKILFFFNFSSKIKTILFIISNFFLSFLEIIGLSMLVPLLILIFQTDKSISNGFLKDFSMIIQDNISLNLIIFIIFIIYLLKSIFFIFLTNWKLNFVNEISIKISKKLLIKYLSGSQEYFSKKNSGELLRNVTSETRKIIKTLIASADLLIDVTMLLAALFFLSFVNLKPSIIIFACLVLFIMVYFLFLKNLLLRLATKNITLMADALKYLVECFRGYSEIFISNKQYFFINRYIDKDKLILKYKRFDGIIKILPRILIELIIVTVILYFLISASGMGKDLNLIFFELTIYGAVFFRLYPSIGKSISNIQTIISCKPSLYLIFDEIINVSKIFVNKKNILISDKFKIDNIQFKNVHFFFDKKKKILENFNKTILKNSIIGIAGKSGVGKTTLMHLLSGLINPTEGEIIVNDINVKDFKNWNEKIAYVSQKPFVIDSTIRDNVCLGEDDKLLNEERLKIAYKDSGLDEFINSLDYKDLSNVGDSGSFVSGGQIQRIGIARALYKNANLILLDEITSNLDENIQSKIMKNILELKNGRIIFLISHDKKILDYCDDIINL